MMSHVSESLECQTTVEKEKQEELQLWITLQLKWVNDDNGKLWERNLKKFCWTLNQMLVHEEFHKIMIWKKKKSRAKG